MTLDDDDYRIIEAPDGTTALELARQQLPDLLILDWIMPGLNGMEVAQALREDPVTAHIPIIMLSARSQEADKERGRAVGASAYLVKPFSPMELRQTVKEILGRSAQL